MSIPERSQDEVAELRALLRRITRGLWSRRRSSPELHGLVGGDPQLGRRHVGLLAQVAAQEGQTIGALAEAAGVSLPAASKLATDLESHGLVRRSEDADDRRRTVVGLDPRSAERVRAWLGGRDRPLELALDALDARERAAFLKGLGALADALMEESEHGPLRSHHRHAHRRRPHRDRPV